MWLFLLSIGHRRLKRHMREQSESMRLFVPLAPYVAIPFPRACDRLTLSLFLSLSLVPGGMSLVAGPVRRRIKEKLGINVRDRLPEDIAHPFAVAPPMRGIVVRVRHGDDSNRHVFAEGFLEKQAR